MGKLFINNKPIVLSKDEKVAITYQFHLLNNLESRQSSYSNQFKAPVCKENKEVLENTEDIPSQTLLPYQSLSAKYIADTGEELITGGLAIMQQATKQEYEISLHSGNVSFFDVIKDKKLTDLISIATLDHCRRASVIEGSRTNTDGYIYPIIDYGNLDKFGSSVKVHEIFPAVFICTLIEMIYQEAGWTYSGAIKNLLEYQELIIPFSRSQFRLRDISYKQLFLAYLSATVNGIQVLTGNTNTNRKIPLDLKTFDTTNNLWCDSIANAPGNFDISANQFVAPCDGEYKFSAQLHYNIVHNSGDNAKIKIALRKDISTLYAEAEFDTANGAPYTGNLPIETDYIFLQKGAIVGLWTYFEPTDIVNDSLDIYGGTDTFLSCIDTRNLTPDFEQHIEMVNTIPQILQSDLIKAIAQKYNCLLVTDEASKNVKWVMFNEITDKLGSAKDMKDKHIDAKADIIEFRDTSYAQENDFLYTNDQYINPTSLGKGMFTIGDTNLAPKKTLITSLFSASETINTLLGTANTNIWTAKIPLLASDGTFVDSPGTRILRLTRLNGYSFGYNYDGTIYGTHVQNNYTTDIPFAYFISPNTTENLDWQSLLDRFYSGLIFSLQHYKKVTGTFNLDPIDVEEFNLTPETPWYLPYHEAYFYVNQLINHIEGTLTQTEIIRLS